MNLKLFFTSLFLLLLPLNLNASDDTWQPFSFPSKLDQSSIYNIGKLVLDAPAGKHGFCKVKDGHFYFEDGTRAKFWGTNLCFNACFPTHKQAEMLAERIAYFGFNAVRLHHMDFYFEPKGIFEDICPVFKDPQMKKTTKLSAKQLEKLDYLIYQLKIRGIYVDMNLLVSRHFTEADGVKYASELGMAAKPYSMFDKKLIELQKQYAKDLLTHYNPYTKLKYCDDPVISLVEIINETTVKNLNFDKTPPYYKEELEKIKSEWFKVTDTADKQAFIDYVEKNYYAEMTSFLKKDVGVKIPITGSQYSTPQALFYCDFLDKHSYWDHPKFPNKQWDNNDFTITNKSILLDNNLGIIGRLKKSFSSYLEPRTLNLEPKIMPFTITEWNHCYPNQYAYETPFILATEALKNDWDALFQFAFSHEWKTEPALNDVHSYFDTISNPQQLILSSLGSLVFLKDDLINSSFKDRIYALSTSNLKAAIGFIKDKEIDLYGEKFKASENGVFAFLKNNKKWELISVSEVKNTASGWDKEGKFDWGKSPVLMKKIKVEMIK